MLIYKIQKYLENKHFNYDDVSQYIEVVADHTGEHITKWEGDFIGTDEPSYKELEAISVDEVAIYNVKKMKIKEIESLRKEEQYSNIECNGYTIFGTEKARDNFFKASMLAKESNQTSINWLDINDEPITIELVDAYKTMYRLKETDTALYTKEAYLNKKVIEANSIEELNAIVW